MKDHKTKRDDELHQSRLVTPAESFMSSFSELGYLAAKEILIKNKANTEKFTIEQASSLKRDLEDLNINKERNSVASTDTVDFCPLVLHGMTEKAVCFFAKDVDENDKKKLKVSLELLKIGMSTQTIQFNGT